MPQGTGCIFGIPWLLYCDLLLGYWLAFSWPRFLAGWLRWGGGVLLPRCFGRWRCVLIFPRLWSTDLGFFGSKSITVLEDDDLCDPDSTMVLVLSLYLIPNLLGQPLTEYYVLQLGDKWYYTAVDNKLYDWDDSRVPARAEFSHLRRFYPVN